MREHGLLAPTRWVHARGPRAHDGTIKTTAPDRMWGTDATRFWTDKEGLCWLFVAVDHCVEDVVGWHAAKVGDRFAALEPVRQGVSSRLGPIGKDVARGLALRHGPPARPRSPVSLAGLPERDRLSGHHLVSGLRRGTGG